jgi:hypothetical protein
VRSRPRSDLLAQIATCELLADELDAGHIGPEILLAHVTELREHFDALPVVPFATAPRVEHRRTPRLATTVTDELRDTLDRLRDHLSAQGLRPELA